MLTRLMSRRLACALVFLAVLLTFAPVMAQDCEDWRDGPVWSAHTPDVRGQVAVFGPAGHLLVGDGARLLVIELPTDAAPGVLASLAMPATIEHIFVLEGLVYAACEGGYLVGIDVGDPTVPTVVRGPAVVGRVDQMGSLQNGFLVIFDGRDDQIGVIETDPGRPLAVVRSFPFPQNFSDVQQAASGDERLYLAGNNYFEYNVTTYEFDGVNAPVHLSDWTLGEEFDFTSSPTFGSLVVSDGLLVASLQVYSSNLDVPFITNRTVRAPLAANGEPDAPGSTSANKFWYQLGMANGRLFDAATGALIDPLTLDLLATVAVPGHRAIGSERIVGVGDSGLAVVDIGSGRYPMAVWRGAETNTGSSTGSATCRLETDYSEVYYELGWTYSLLDITDLSVPRAIVSETVPRTDTQFTEPRLVGVTDDVAAVGLPGSYQEQRVRLVRLADGVTLAEVDASRGQAFLRGNRLWCIDPATEELSCHVFDLAGALTSSAPVSIPAGGVLTGTPAGAAVLITEAEILSYTCDEIDAQQVVRPSGRYPLSDPVSSHAWFGNLLFLPHRDSSRVEAVDMGDPAAPRFMAWLDLGSGEVASVQVDGDWAAVVSTAGQTRFVRLDDRGFGTPSGALPFASEGIMAAGDLVYVKAGTSTYLCDPAGSPGPVILGQSWAGPGDLAARSDAVVAGNVASRPDCESLVPNGPLPWRISVTNGDGSRLECVLPGGQIAVTFYGSAFWPAADIDPASVRAGPGSATSVAPADPAWAPGSDHLDGDDYPDLRLWFDAGSMGLACDATHLAATGLLRDGRAIAAATRLVVPAGQLEARVDLIPDDDANRMLCQDLDASVPVVVYGSPTVEPTTLPPHLVRLAGTPSGAAPPDDQDFDGDGWGDRRFWFPTAEIASSCDTDSLLFSGETTSGFVVRSLQPVTWFPDSMAVRLDLIPADAGNTVFCTREDHALPLAVYGEDRLDVMAIDFDAVRMASAGALEFVDGRSVVADIADIDGDGRLDRRFWFRTGDVPVACDADILPFSGEAEIGRWIGGEVPVTIRADIVDTPLELLARSAENYIACDPATGRLDVTVYSTPEYDMTALIGDEATLGLAAALPPQPGDDTWRDFDGDGRVDRRYWFEAGATGLECGGTELVFRAVIGDGRWVSRSFAVVAAARRADVRLDLQPDDPANEVACDDDDGEVFVLVYGADGFAAAYPVPGSIRLGAAGPVSPEVLPGDTADFDGDGFTDRRFRFRFGDTGLACGDSEVVFEGQTVDHEFFSETLVVRTVAGSGDLPTRWRAALGPNPFNAGTSIRLDVERSRHVEIVVYDLRGRAVRHIFEGTVSPGRHDIPWDGRSDRGRALASGAYFFRIGTDGMGEILKGVLVK